MQWRMRYLVSTLSSSGVEIGGLPIARIDYE